MTILPTAGLKLVKGKEENLFRGGEEWMLLEGGVMEVICDGELELGCEEIMKLFDMFLDLWCGTGIGNHIMGTVVLSGGNGIEINSHGVANAAQNGDGFPSNIA